MYGYLEGGAAGKRGRGRGKRDQAQIVERGLRRV